MKHSPIAKPATLKHFWFIPFGIVLPLLVVLVESTTHFCARQFFDPFPSPSYVMLFLLIPATNFLIWLSITHRANLSAHYAALTLCSGMAAGVALMYSLMFLPILPISALCAFIGIGFLGLSPMLSVPCSILSGRAICDLATNRTYFNPHQMEHLGHLIVLVMVIAIELPSTLTRVHLDMANKPSTAPAGIEWLRQNGNQDVMLRACYERSGRATDVLGSLYESARPLSVDAARRIFYRVTGKPFNAVPIPPSARATIQHAGLEGDVAGVNAKVDDEFDLDANIGGESVSGQARGLSATEQAIHAKVDPDALLAHLDWSIVLSNTSKYDREARGKIHLPPGSVLNRVTLKIRDKERDAQIMLRSKARVKYVQSIEKHLDPLLVSFSAPNEVLVQCFPVEPSEPVTVKFSLVCPLALKGTDKASLELPVVSESNFHELVPIKIEVDSTKAVALSRPLTGEDGKMTGTARGGKSLHLEMESKELESFRHSIDCNRDERCSEVYSLDEIRGNLVSRHLGKAVNPLPSKLVVVVDGSASMAEYIPEIVAGLKGLPATTTLDLFKIGDSDVPLCTNVHPGDQHFLSAMSDLERGTFVGGQDDSVVLLREIQTCLPDGAVLWIHGCQPVCGVKKESFTKLLNAGHQQPLVYDFPVATGPVELVQGMNPSASLLSIPRVDTIKNDLSNLFSTWTAHWQKLPEFSRQPAEPLPEAAHQVNSELAQLAAFQQIIDDLDAPGWTIDSERGRDATKIANDYKLVSPVSSAIVTNLAKDEQQKVATGIGPESDTWLLLLVVAGILMMQVAADKRKEAVVS